MLFKRVNITNRVPETRCRTAECSPGGWNKKVAGGRRSKWARGCVNEDEFQQTGGSKVMYYFIGEQQKFELNVKNDGETVQFLKNWININNGGGSANDTGSRDLNQMKFMQGLERKTKQKGITIINARVREGRRRCCVNGRRQTV